jgi:16S rRNA G1207 methylase RsmC
MPFDPNWPPTNAEVESAPFRNQFNSLNDQDSALQTQLNALTDALTNYSNTADMEAEMFANTAGSVATLAKLNLVVSNPPTQAQMQAIADKMDEFITLAQRP